MKLIERFSRKPAPQQPVPAPGAAPLLMALEPRIMFDASVAVVAQDAAAQTGADAAKDSAPSQDASQPPAATADATGQPDAQRQEVVFIDGNVSNLEQLLSGLSGKPEVVILDPNKDGLQQMADYLKGREGLDAIHLLSHGADGTVQMGNVWLNSGNLAEHSAALESVGAALKADGDLMLYGCKVGENSKGQALLDGLAAITGADVAASTDDTGAAALGGNWTLERVSGSIETTPLGAELGGYENLLAASYTTGSGQTLPANALARYVIGDFNNDGIDDILFQPGTNGTAWQLALGSSSGVFTYYAASDAQYSPFSNVGLIDAAGNGTNYYAADFDNDGDTDLLGVAVSGGSAYLYRYDTSTGKYTRENASGFTDAQLGVRLVVGDFNGDGAADILYTPGTANVWRYAQNNGNGTFTTLDQGLSPFANVSLIAITTYNYRVVDFDGDGDLDVFAFSNNSSGFLYRNDAGVFSSAPTVGLPSVPLAARAVIGDFDGDGDADILYQMADLGAWKYASQNADGSFTAAVDLINSSFGVASLPNMGFQNVRVGDFDGDGDKDVIGSVAASSAMVYYQSGGLPKLVSATPADDSLNVSTSANITLTFSESVTLGSGFIYIVRLRDGAVVQSIAAGSSALSGSGTTWVIDPPADLAQGTEYAIRIDGKAFVNADGKAFGGILNNSALNFTTVIAQPPVIGNLNGDSVTHIEGAPVTLIDAGGNATVSDADSANFNGGNVTVRISSNNVASEDVLWITHTGSGVGQIGISGNSVSYGGVLIGLFTGGSLGNPLVISLNGAATPAAVSALLHNLAYRNAGNGDISTVTRTVQVTVNDGTGSTSNVASVTLNVSAVNDAPVVNTIGTSPTYTEDGAAVQLFSGTSISTVEAGQTIVGVVFTVSNLGNGAAEKLVIDGSDVSLVGNNSVFTSGNGMTVTVTVSGSTATVTLTHTGLAAATAQSIVNSIAYRNDSQGPSGSARVVTLESVRDSGGTANGGLDTRLVNVSSTVSVVAVNDAPTLSGGPFVMASTNEDTVTGGNLVSAILGSVGYSDVDPGALAGIAITATSGRGIWQYSTDGISWSNFGSVSSSSALLLTASTQVRYIPDGANGENVGFTFRAWDRTTGTASITGSRGLADTTSNGGSTAFSSGTAQATLVVSSVNDAPLLNPQSPALTGLIDTATNNAGDPVSALVGGVTDVDSGALKGVAITGLTTTHGVWQFSTDSGTTWLDIGVVSDSAALILRSSDRVRFVPDGFHGETATLTYKAWDQSNGTAGLQGVKLDTSTSGGTSAFSTSTDTASVVVTAVNEAPTLAGSGGSVAWTEGNNTTSVPVVIDNGITITDPDGPGIASATVRISANYSTGQDYLALVNNPATMGNISASWDAASGTLTLTSAGNQATLAQFQAALRAVTFSNLSDAPATQTRTVEFKVNDGGLDSSAVTRSITLTAVDDAPVISAPTTILVVEDTASVINQISVSDADSASGTVTLSVLSGSLGATSGAGVTVGGNTMTLTLTGTLSAINAFIASNRVTYIAAANANGDVTLTITANTGSISNDSRAMTLTIIPVNDTPVVTVPGSITVTEDVPGAITGVSFSDVDAGSGSVTATFSVPSGTLSAVGGQGVVVGGDGTDRLTLTGTLADINAFIAGNNLSYRTALNATNSVTLTVTINDNGNTGGSPLTDTKTVTISVNAVNDAPVNSVPGAQTVAQNGSVAFNDGNGNAISISDVDAGSSLMTVTLSTVNGTMNLANTSGVTLLIGTGLNNAVIRIQGSQANLNAALQSLVFTPTSGYQGPAQLIIQTNDQGNTGSGGAWNTVGTIMINVVPVNPKVTDVSAQGLDRTVKIGDEVLVNVVFDQAVFVDASGGTPSLLLETGLVDRNAVYLSGSGSNTLVFKYTVQAGDLSADLDFQSTAALQLNGGALANATHDLAILTLPTVGGADSLGGRSNIVVDGVVPVVASVSAPADGTYIPGQNLDFTVNFSERVVVDSSGGVPRIAVTLDTGGTVYAQYVSGSGSSALVFRLTAASGQLDSNGVTLGGSVQLNGGSIRDAAGNDTQVTLNSVASTANVNIDGVVPAVVSVATPSDGSYKAGDVLTFTVNASEALQTGALAPRLVLNVGGATRYATYVSGNGSAALVFQYTVQAGDNDADGIAVSSLDLRGEQLTDLAGNDMNLALNGMGSTAGILVDTTVPAASSIVRVDASPSNSGSVSFTVTFSEDVSGVDASDFSLVLSGSATGSISSVTAVDGHTYTVLVSGLSGVGSLRLDLNSSGNGIADAAGNLLAGGLAGASYSIDRVAPSVTHVDVPANGSYVAGQNLDFTVHFDEAVQLDTSGGTPRLEITLDNGAKAYASYLSGAGSNALVFRLTVTSGQMDSDGISVGSNLQLNGATLRDSVGNDALIALNGVGDTRQVLVDAIVPQVSSVELPAPGAYNAGDVLRFTVAASEKVIVDTTTGTPRLVLNIGGVTRYAAFVSGSGSDTLVFEYTVEPGNNSNGVTLGANLELNGGTLRDAAGNDMALALGLPAGDSGIVIDTVAPRASLIANVDVTPTNAGAVRYTVTFDEGVSGVDAADFSLVFSGSASGRIASVVQLDGRTYSVLVDNLSGAGDVRLDLNASGTGIVDVAGNPLAGGLQGSSYSIDRTAPAVTSVTVPANGTYVAGQVLDFTVNTDEAVLVDSGDGNPRLAITLDNGRVVYADYLSGSGSTALVFRLAVTSGMSGNSTFAVGAAIDLNGGTLRDARGNDANTSLNQVGDTAAIQVDAQAPRPSSIVVDGPVLPTDRTLSFTLRFDEAVSGVDAGDFSVLGTGSASAVVQSVQRIDAQTYRVVVGDLRGQGSLALSLNALGSGIQDQAGNLLAASLLGQAQAIATQDVGDLQYRLDPPATGGVAQIQPLGLQSPVVPTADSVSPLAAPALFEVRTVGGDLQPLGTIFLGQAGSAPSFIAQVFASSAAGIGGQGGFFGFGGGDGGVFASSTFATLFSREVPGVSEMNVFNGSQWRQSELNQGLRGVFGAPTLGQQLQRINDADQRQVREMAQALAQPTQIGTSA